MILYMPFMDCKCGAHPHGAPSQSSPPLLASRGRGKNFVTRMVHQDAKQRLCCPWCFIPFPTK